MAAGADRPPRIATLCAAAARAAASRTAPALMAEVAALADQLVCADLGLKPPECRPWPLRASSSSVTPIIRTQMIYSSPELEVVIFVFPAGASIPLHDHPNMHVFSKVLFSHSPIFPKGPMSHPAFPTHRRHFCLQGALRFNRDAELRLGCRKSCLRSFRLLRNFCLRNFCLRPTGSETPRPLIGGGGKDGRIGSSASWE